MDSSEYTNNKIISWIILFFTLFGSALSWFFDLTPYLPSTDWRWLATIFSLLFIGTSIYRINNLERILSSRKPKIEIHESPYITELPFNEERWIISSDLEGMDNKIAKIAFINNPKNNTELNHAKRLSAQLTYRDINGNKLFGPVYAHWSNSDIPKEKIDVMSKRFIYRDLDSSGACDSIYLAIKNESSKWCYAFTDESYLEGFENPKFCLNSNIIEVEILLKGERVKKIFKCRIYNDGESTPLRIELQRSWIRRNFSFISKFGIYG